MLKNTFHHIPGVGAKSEKQLWASGIKDWDCFREQYQSKLTQKRVKTLIEYLQESRKHLENKNSSYFEKLLPANLHWRFFPEFRNETVYLDIETDGLDSYYRTITTIAMYDGESLYHYVKDQNLDDFVKDIKNYKVIVSYNGKCFDIPFIQDYFGIKLDHAHIDLRYVLGSLGYKGGLKNCELAFGIDRGPLNGVDGFFAVLLWDDYQENGNKKALETLLAYNIEDVVNLETLMVMAYNMKIEDTPFRESHQVPLPSAPEIPFNVDNKTVQKIKGKIFSSDFYEYY